MVIYLAGPMRGYKRYNFPAFDVVRDRLQGLGHVVISPADLDRQFGFDEVNDEPPSLRDCILRDLHAIAESAEAIALLPGWERSRGAAVEVALANFLELPLLDSETLESI